MDDAGEVLIVGAGPVGMLTALALVQQGVAVTLIEAEDDIMDSPRAMVYFPSSLVGLEKLGLLDDLIPLGLKGRSAGHHVRDLDFKAELSLKHLAGITFDYQLHCGQEIVARVAMEHAVKLGAKVLFKHRLAGLAEDEDGVIATVIGPDGARDLRARYLVGADGARSTVRRLIGVEFAGHTWSNRFVSTNVYCDFDSLGMQAANFVCDPTYMAVIAVIDREGLWRLTYQEDAALPAETFMERLPERYAYHIPAGVPYEIKAARPYTIHQRCATSLRRGRVLLAGDAAHATNPCGGMGLTTGLWSGLILSDLLGAVLRGEEEDTILDRYSEERRRVFWEVSSPGATENKRILEESDMEQRRKDCAAVQAAADDPNVTRLMMSFPFRTIGDPLRAGSRWANINPLAEAGIDISQRKSQLI